ncbi:FG-GAP-like repeat-containing protein [Phormidesmis sp. 146-35]
MPPILGNNSFETAKEILSPALSTKEELGSLSSATGGDLTDYFKFTLTGSSSISLSLTGLTGNARLRAFSAPNEASEITPSGTSNPQRLSESIILNNVQPGTYYVKVDLDSTDSTATSADYSLKVGANTSLNSSSILWRAADGTNGVWLMNGKDYSEVGFTPQKTSNWRPTVGDFNGDGEDDVFWQNTTDGSLEIWLMQGKSVLEVGTPKFNNQSLFLDAPWKSYVGDFDGNGKSDIFWHNQSTGVTAVWLMDGIKIADANLTPAFPARSTWAPEIADFDGNGNDDILWRNAPTGELAIWIMKGRNLDTPTSFSYFSGVPREWVPTAVDLTGDGGADLLWRNTSTGDNVVWLMTGKDRQSFDSLFSSPALTSWTPQTGDFNGDGITDIFWRDSFTRNGVTSGSGTNGIWNLDGNLGMGQKLTSFGFLLTNEVSWKIEAITDFNGDGKDDMLWRNSDGTVGVWLIDTTGTKLTEGKALADFAIAPSKVPLDWKMDGILKRNLTNKPQSISGPSEATAFDVGTLNTGTNVSPATPGVYRDAVTATAPDFFKFNIATQSNFTMTPTGSVTLQLFRQGAAGTPSTLVAYTAGMDLGVGTYFVKVNTTANTSTAYSLTLLGTPQIVNLLGESFTAPVQIPLDEPSTATPNPATKVNVSYSIRNGGTVSVSGVKVNFVISRDSVIDASDRLIGTDLVQQTIAAGSPSTVRTSQVTLPNIEDTFWTVDKNYYIGVIVDPDNAFTETSETDNFNVAIAKDKFEVNVTRTITADPRAISLSVTPSTSIPITSSSSSTLSATYAIGNAGNKAILDSETILTKFYLSKDNVFGDGDRDLNEIPNAIPARTDLSPAQINLALPPKGDGVWQNLTGTQQFYIIMVVNTNGIPESDPTNNLTSSAITVDLGV